MFVSVTIQTYNNAAILAGALESLRSLRCPENVEYEILVVDNNCTDGTAEVLRRYSDLLSPRFRSVRESKQGLCHARNCALAEAGGDIVSFVDEDVIVDPNWLCAVSAAFAKHSASVVGGRSYLLYPESLGRPEWLPVELETMYSRLDHGPETLVGTDKDLYGLNFSVLKRVALEVGGFNPLFSRSVGNLLTGDEADLLSRVRQIGGIVVYEPAAVVGHRVPASRLTKEWVLARARCGAVSAERLLRTQGKQSKGVGSLLIHALRCWGSVGRARLLRGVTPQEFFDRQYSAAVSWGRFMGALSASPKPERPVASAGVLSAKGSGG
ncbi:MAG TPA: glycosyltransferase [Sedimentisphaerales bacterium]|nr:glycosyltransferase [Sedimentisphaerales bacterium]